MQSFNTLTIFRSSAGSGKTYTLVKEYLKLTLSNPPSFKQVLAITFTNKATDEMKSRIVKTLVDFTEGKSTELKEELKNILNKSEENFNLDVQKLLGLILHDYSGFAVCTIDSFFNKVIRSLSKEMGLPLKFDTELNQDVVIREITGQLLLDAGKDTRLTSWLEDFIFSKMSEDKGWKIDAELHGIARELFKDDFRAAHNPEENISNDFIKELQAIKNSFESAMKSFGNEFSKTIAENNVAVADFSYGKSGVAGYFEKIKMKISPKDYEPGKRTTDANADPEKWVSKSSEKKGEILQLVEDRLRFILEKIFKHIEKHFRNYITADEVLKLIYVAGIVNKLDEKLKIYRDENDVLLISDTNLLLKDFISGADAPFIYEKTGNRYRHFMIDEFQDTSAFQWNNMLPLVENSLAAGSSAMMVGDAKQSIYRWRGGKMQLLLNGIQNDLRHYAAITAIENLQTNFRSRKEIVAFNNAFFTEVPAHLPLPQITDEEKNDLVNAYKSEEVEQKISGKNNEGGYVEVTFYEAKNKNDDESDNLNKDEMALQQLLTTLHKLVEQGYELKDVCILVRTNTQGNEIARFLFNNGYKKIVSSESLLIGKAPQIIFLINLMKVLNDSEDKVARAECINHYLTHIHAAENKNGHDIFKIVNDTPLFYQTLPHDFSNHLSRLKKLPLYELAEQLTGIFELNKQPDAYIQRFQDLILEYLEKNPPSLSVFLQWWNEENDSDKASVIVPSDENAIRIMSIHKSKGLQFPVVIMPFPDWELKPKSNNILWVHSDRNPYSQYSLLPVHTTAALEKTFFVNQYNAELQQTLIDNLNLLYVAFTRAEERLYLFCPEAKTEKISKTSNLICSVFESGEKWKEKITATNGLRKYATGMETVKEKKIREKNMDETSFEQPHIIALKKYNSNPWQNKLVLAVNKNKISVDDDETLAVKSDFGILMHHILSKIIFLSDTEKIIHEFLSSKIISNEQSTEIKKIIEDVLKICEPYKWFSTEWKIKTEAQMLLPDGAVIRPDRIMIKGKSAVLLDYKTGEENSLHEQQLYSYEKNLLNAGYESVEKYLLYLNPVKLLKL
ncbi:MAG TPA: UvrD-helicase domain-containing protein [Bacteroidia bacterium]|nr:UvrD-helicase domain-containing protein [Bacteroidia bacterium]